MFWLTKQAFIELLSFREYLATECVSLSTEPRKARPTLIIISLNPTEPNYYPIMISLNKCNESCKVFCDFITKTCVPSKTKYVNIKTLNKITKIYEAKKLVKHISCDFK